MQTASYYRTPEWRRLSRAVKVRDGQQCQVCGDRRGDPHCVLHAHHVIPRASGGADSLANLSTLCDLCHAVVTPRWRRPWFGSAATEHRSEIEACSRLYTAFLSLPLAERTRLREQIWSEFRASRNG